MSDNTVILEVKELHKSFDGHEVLKGISTTIKKGDVLFIIESMKLMNEVQSEIEGTVAEILVGNGEAVEYDQPILRVE